jgi:predicted nucleotidyltransferase
MKKDLQHIMVELRKLLPYITQKYDVNSIELFGSFVRNQQDTNNDLDILVTFSKVPSLLKFIELKNYISDELQVNVDLVMKDSLKPRISHDIFTEPLML